MQYQPDYPPRTSGLSRESVLARKRVRNHLRGKWQQDADFFAKFFPLDAPVVAKLSRIRKRLYRESEKDPRWPGFPKSAKPGGDSRLCTALNTLLNNILAFFSPPSNHFDKCLFIKTYRRKVLSDADSPIWPGILLAGCDPSLIHSASPRPIADYNSAMCPIEVVPEGEDAELAQQRLAVVVQEMFNHQPNRRFAFGLVVSPRTLRCYLFDHSGAVASPPLAYHTQPAQFCALVAGLTDDDFSHTGLDTSMFKGKRKDCYISAGAPSEDGGTPAALYAMSSNLYHAPYIIGRGTTCFLTYLEHDLERRYVIKDAWVSTGDPELAGRESEAALLLHAKSKGVVRGIAQIWHYEDVQFRDRDGNLLTDDIYNIRRVAPSEYCKVRQRVHTRMILSTYGVPLEHFSSRKELLLAYYDAVRAHRSLYETAGILHRDIKPGNILINADGAEGDRGILIDFDRAIRTDNTSPYSLHKSIGTHLFMSTNALEGENPQGYLDDLESFYYVLIYIITLYTGPRRAKDKLPENLNQWQSSQAIGLKKGQFLLQPDQLGIEPWFGPVFQRLVDKLQLIFRTRFIDAAQNSPPTPLGPLEESDKFISYVRQATIELESEELSPSSNSGIPQDTSSPSAKRRRIADPHTLGALRSLRSNVDYRRCSAAVKFPIK